MTVLIRVTFLIITTPKVKTNTVLFKELNNDVKSTTSRFCSLVKATNSHNKKSLN
jgi:hypothetical protein